MMAQESEGFRNSQMILFRKYFIALSRSQIDIKPLISFLLVVYIDLMEAEKFVASWRVNEIAEQDMKKEILQRIQYLRLEIADIHCCASGEGENTLNPFFKKEDT